MKSVQRSPCPICGCQPELLRVIKSYWKAACPNNHISGSITGHTMKTQKAAWQTWESAYGPNAEKE